MCEIIDRELVFAMAGGKMIKYTRAIRLPLSTPDPVGGLVFSCKRYLRRACWNKGPALPRGSPCMLISLTHHRRSEDGAHLSSRIPAEREKRINTIQHIVQERSQDNRLLLVLCLAFVEYKGNAVQAPSVFARHKAVKMIRTASCPWRPPQIGR